MDRCTETFNNNQAVFGDTYSFTPTLIGDFRLSYLRFSYDRTALTAGYDLTQLGWPASLNNQVVFRVVPLPNVTGYNGVFSTSGTGQHDHCAQRRLFPRAQLDQNLGQPHAEIRRRDPPEHAQLLSAEQPLRELSISTR